MSRALVLLSGGIDSYTSAAIAKNLGHQIYALTIDYGQRHRREIESAKIIASSLNVKKHLILNIDLRQIGGSALTSDIDMPTEAIKETIPSTYVPARNTIFLSIALGWAEVMMAEDIYIGATAVDYSGYPDCRPEYFKAFEAMANLATKVSIEGTLRFKINAPLINMSKGQIIKKGMELGLDYGLSWSCYDPSSDGSPCGRCDSCIYRAKGFKEAGIEDTLLL